MEDKQFVVFNIGQEEYGVDITSVNEITEYKKISTLPNLPTFVEGIINIRGCIVPIIDLKKRFNIYNKKTNAESIIIIANISDKTVGFVVDSVSHVLKINHKNIEPSPDIFSDSERQYIEGIGKVEERIIVLLNLQTILTKEEKQKFSQFDSNK